ncbi:MAG: methyltransferase domain-containing protein [Anaerolineae bacterium]|nr:methyltransferase domain-containing protein [Anaerolineae bacterium]
MTDSDYGEALLEYNHYMMPLYQAALATVDLPSGSHGLDVGCGAGGLFGLLDKATGCTGHITGIDICDDLLTIAAKQAALHNMRDRIRLQTADLEEPLPFSADTFDWAWAADVLHPQVFSTPAIQVKELVRVVKPGGTVMVFFLHPFRSLVFPGRPHLEAVLRRVLFAGSRYDPACHPDNAAAWLRWAGLTHVTTSAHTALFNAPFGENAWRYDLVPDAVRDVPPETAQAAGIAQGEWHEVLRLIDPQSPDYLLRQEDYFCVRLALLTSGRVPA